MRECRTCGTAKPDSEFYFRRDINEYRSECRVCTRGRVRRAAAANPERVRARNVTRALKLKYGLTVEQRDRLLDAQGHVCAVCGRGGRLVVDHDHRTQRVRGMLCVRCNTSLGWFEKGERIARVIAYLGTAGDPRFYCKHCGTRLTGVTSRNRFQYCSPRCRSRGFSRRGRQQEAMRS